MKHDRTFPTVTRHWRERVLERVGPDMDPDFLWAGIEWAIQNHRTDLVRYLGRQDRKGKRRWLIRVPDGREFVVVAVESTPITILTPEMTERQR